MKKIIGPFCELLPMSGLPMKGSIKDENLPVVKEGAILVEEGKISAVGSFQALLKLHPNITVEEISGDFVGLPGLIDCHTHICFGGSRAKDYAARNNGKSYQDIAAAGGGIWDTVTKTRTTSQDELGASTELRLDQLLQRGITTVEVKSGYGLTVSEELKMLRAINTLSSSHRMDIVATCLAAHIIPREFSDEEAYLSYILQELVPQVRGEQLSNRFDIFIEENAFTPSKSIPYLNALKASGFDITVHGDQFSTGGSATAIQVGARSVDHLEASGDSEIKALSKSSVVPVVLPGASIGLGISFAPARALLDAGCSLAIASDWNPGSAPQGNLLMQAALLGAYEKLSAAEVFSGITFRAAAALGLSAVGSIVEGLQADFIGFSCDDYREILYHQGALQPSIVWKKGIRI